MNKSQVSIELKKIALSKIKERMESKGNDAIINSMKDTINKEFYESHIVSREVYRRTYQLRDSVSLLEFRESSDRLTYIYGHDISKTDSLNKYENPPIGRARTGYGSPKGKDVREMVPDWSNKRYPYYEKCVDNVKRDVLPKISKE